MHTTVPAADHAGRAATLRACVVDRSPAVRDWLTGTLAGVGIEVAAASDTVADGLATVFAERPDLVVVDGRLPDGRGVDLCRRVALELPQVALVLHTSVISPAEEAEAREAGVWAVALKSIQGGSLLAALHEVASRYRDTGPAPA